jgi:hypothetical protein
MNLRKRTGFVLLRQLKKMKECDDLKWQGFLVDKRSDQSIT